MNLEDANVIMELEDMLDEAEMDNLELLEDNDELKDLLIGALLELNQYQRENIDRLVALDDEEFCDCPDCH